MFFQELITKKFLYFFPRFTLGIHFIHINFSKKLVNKIFSKNYCRHSFEISFNVFYGSFSRSFTVTSSWSSFVNSFKKFFCTSFLRITSNSCLIPSAIPLRVYSLNPSPFLNFFHESGMLFAFALNNLLEIPSAILR